MTTKILVVDDDVDSLKLIGLMLQRQGYEVNGANTGSNAIERAVSEQPDLIILDVMMPDMDGYTVCRQLRANDRTRDIPIIMFTAKTLIDDKVAGFEAGADDYLTKPTHPAELASRVKAVLARSAAARSGVASAPTSGITFAFVGAKGGIGTSTLATNIGALLATRDNTVLVDFRLGQGTLGLSLGFPRSTGLANILGRPSAEINTKTIEAEIVTHQSGLRLLPSSARPRENQLNVSQEVALEIVKTLQAASSNVLIDLGAGLNRLSARIVREADQIILITEPNRVALAMARHLLQEIRQIGVGENNINVVIVNRAQSSLQVSWQEAEQFLGHPITAIISPAPEQAFQAAEVGTPMVKLQPDSIVANQYAKLVEELVKRTKEY